MIYSVSNAWSFFHNYINDRVPVFFRSFFVEHALYHDYETRHCHNICIPHSHTTKARTCIRYHIHMLLNMLPAQITAKWYTHSHIGFVNYTKQLLLNEYSNTCLIENCYVCKCVETWCVFLFILHFFYNIVHFCEHWQKNSFVLNMIHVFL